MTSSCMTGMPEGAPGCADLQALDQCVKDDPQDPCTGDEVYTSRLQIWLDCTCNNNCAAVDEATSDPNSQVIEPLTFNNPWLNSDFHVGTQIIIPGYEEDAFGSFFRYDMNDLHDSSWNKSPWDKFSAFNDVKYQFDEGEGRCMPFVKIESGDFVMLKTFDGVDIACALDFAVADKFVQNELRKAR